jgi:hypothetical protein
MQYSTTHRSTDGAQDKRRWHTITSTITHQQHNHNTTTTQQQHKNTTSTTDQQTNNTAATTNNNRGPQDPRRNQKPETNVD